MDKIYLKKLKAANFPACDFVALRITFEVAESVDPKAKQAVKNFKDEIIEYLNDYLKVFLAPVEVLDKEGKLDHIKCRNCDRPLGGLFGSFTWAFAHGEGFCSACGYPGRAAHYLEHEGWKLTMNRILQYHPDFLERRKKGG